MSVKITISPTSSLFIERNLHIVKKRIQLLLRHLYITGSCNETLGLESGDILDEHITASSSFDSHNTGPQNAR